ncbi:hypothetical protein bcgnr5390_48980 [Bacillus luti]
MSHFAQEVFQYFGQQLYMLNDFLLLLLPLDSSFLYKFKSDQGIEYLQTVLFNNLETVRTMCNISIK